MGSFKSRITRIERSFVGAGMRMIALIAERKVRRGLSEGATKPAKHGLHVNLDERGRPKL